MTDYDIFAERTDRRIAYVLPFILLPILAVVAFADLISRPFRGQNDGAWRPW